MDKMTTEEMHKFIMAGTRTGKLATVRADGRPHVVPIWFILDGDDLVFNTWHESVKAKNMQRDPRVTICVDEEQPPFHFVMLEGEVTITQPSPEEAVAWSTRIATRYMGEELGESYGKRNGVEGEYLVRMRITKAIAVKNMSA